MAETLHLKCMNDPVYFIETFCKIIDAKSGKAIPFVGYPKQREMWLAFKASWDDKTGKEPRYMVAGKARQNGFTWAYVALGLWVAMFHQNMLVVFMSEKEDLAKEMMMRVNFMYSHLPEQLQEETIINNTELMWFGRKSKKGVLDTESLNSKIQCVATTTTGVQSKTINFLVIDEAASVAGIQGIFQRSAKPALERANGICAIISTGKPGPFAQGAGRFFQEMYWKAKRDPMYRAFFCPWNGIPGRTQEWYDRMREDAEDLNIFLMEYPSNENEMFQASSKQLFDVKLLQDRKKELILHREPCKRYALTSDNQEDGTWRFDENPKGKIIVYQDPAPDHIYTIGVDAASGVGDDNSVIFVRDATDNSEAACAAGKFRPAETAAIADILGRMYHDALIVPEVEMYGLKVLDNLREVHDYPYIYMRRTISKVENGYLPEMGWKTTRGNRDKLLDDLYHNVNAEGFTVRSIELIDEMCAFEEDEFGVATHPVGGHDDRIFGCALSLQGTKYGMMDAGLSAESHEDAPRVPPTWRELQEQQSDADGNWKYV